MNEEYLSHLVFEFKTNRDEAAINYQDLKAQYERNLAKLPEKQRTVFLMNRMEGLTYTEIAKRLDVSVKTIEKRISQTLSKLRKTIVLSILMIGILCGSNKPCDEVEINPAVNCAYNKKYQPVCGWNQLTCSNQCIAKCHGVDTSVEGV
jgi:DNA-binding CsgD family transcriptional regulator